MHLAATLAVAVVDSGCKRSVKCDEMCKTSWLLRPGSTCSKND